MMTILKQSQDELTRLCRKYHVRRLEAFGSAATGQEFDPDTSDIDFLVEFQPDQDLGPWLKHYFEFQRELETLFGRPVDLVMLSAMRNPWFIREANRTRRLLYAA